MKTQQSISAINAQLSTAVSILDVAAAELQSEWDEIPTVAGVNVTMADVMRDLKDAMAAGNMVEYMSNSVCWPKGF